MQLGQGTTQGSFGTLWDRYWSSVAEEDAAQPTAREIDGVLQRELSQMVTLTTRNRLVKASPAFRGLRIRALTSTMSFNRGRQLARRIDGGVSQTARKLGARNVDY